MQARHIAAVHSGIDARHDTLVHRRDEIFAGGLAASTGFEAAVTQKIPNDGLEVIDGCKWCLGGIRKPNIEVVEGLDVLERTGPHGVEQHHIEQGVKVDREFHKDRLSRRSMAVVCGVDCLKYPQRLRVG